MTMGEQGQARKRTRTAPKPLDSATLEPLALSYVARFATTSAKVERYLQRKLRERGWAGDGDPPIATIVSRFVELGYIDDAVYARARGGDLLRRGYGGRRVSQALSEAGIAADLRESVAPGEAQSRAAAVAFARRRRFGPFHPEAIVPAVREKQFAAMIRAGHGFDIARAVVDAANQSALDEWVAEAADEEER